MNLKLTKANLRVQQYQLQQLQRYLPILQLKRMLFQMEVNQAEQEYKALESRFESTKKQILSYCALFSDKSGFDFFDSLKIQKVETESHNIAGVDVPIFKEVVFQDHPYLLFNSPVWVDSAVVGVKKLITLQEKMKVVEKKKIALEKELHSVSIRVNLFEKVLIPKFKKNIMKIKIFLSDQQLSAVCQAKLAKQKQLIKEMAFS